VTVQTLYLAWGSKRELLRAYIEQALAGTPGLPPADPLPDTVLAQVPQTSDPRTLIAHMAAGHCRIGERAALGWRLYREAAVADADLAEDWLENQRLRRVAYGRLIERLPLEALRPSLTHQSAADTAWALARPECWDLLIVRRRYTVEDYQAWVDGHARGGPATPAAQRLTTSPRVSLKEMSTRVSLRILALPPRDPSRPA
jgi:AcrR family transcriptional regulator